MLYDRLLGVLCLGAAALAATWGGNGVLNEVHVQATRAPGVVPFDALGPTDAAASSGSDLPSGPKLPTGRAAASSTTAVPAAELPGTTVRPAVPDPVRPPAPPDEPPAQVARRALLVQADVPAGFTVTTPAPSDGTTATGSPIERCAGPDGGRLAATVGARARSATFARADIGSVSSWAVVFAQAATAEEVLGQMTGTAARSCFEKLINARLARNPRLSQEVTGALGPAPSPFVGDAALAYRFEVRLPPEDVDARARPNDPPVRFVADFVLIRKGRSLVLAEFDNLHQPWAAGALEGVAASLAARL